MLFYRHPLTLSHVKDRWQCAQRWSGLTETLGLKQLSFCCSSNRPGFFYMIQLKIKKNPKVFFPIIYHHAEVLDYNLLRSCVCVRERVAHISSVILLHRNRKTFRASAMVVVTVSSLATPIRLGKLLLSVCVSILM